MTSTDLELHRDILRPLADSRTTWEHPLSDGLVLCGSRVARRRQGPFERSFLVWFLSGSKQLREGCGESSLFLEGDVLVLPKRAHFQSDELPNAVDGFLAVRVELESEMLRRLGRSEPAVRGAMATASLPGLQPRTSHKPRVEPDVFDALSRCVDYAVRGSRSTSMARRRLEDVLVTLAESAPCTYSALVSEPDPVEWLEDVLRSAPHAPWCLADAARTLGMSSATMKRRLGDRNVSFSSLLRRVRLEEGRRLLVDLGQTVLQAALNVGYASPSKFAAAYQRKFGRPPAEDKSNGGRGSPPAPRGG